MKTGKGMAIVYCLILALTLLIAHYGSAAVFTMVENRPIYRKNTIVIDAGHGGVDGGATSCTGMLEKDFNLQISLRLNDLLGLLGYRTRMIRTDDVSVYTKGETIAQKKVSDLKERLRITKETPNTLLLSIHQNQFPDSRYSGAQVFYAGTAGSEELARQLQKSLVRHLNPGSRRQHKKANGIWLMENAECTALLIECGFLSNHQEEAKLRSAQYQKQLCCVIAAAVAQFMGDT